MTETDRTVWCAHCRKDKFTFYRSLSGSRSIRIPRIRTIHDTKKHDREFCTDCGKQLSRKEADALIP
jgi:hypothetical protein